MSLKWLLKEGKETLRQGEEKENRWQKCMGHETEGRQLG